MITITDLKQKYPDLKKITVNYYGSGDSFESMYEGEFLPSRPENMTLEEVSDLCWYAIDNSEANFNNEGSEGEITIDLENETLKIDNYWIVYEREPSGKIEFKESDLLENNK